MKKAFRLYCAGKSAVWLLLMLFGALGAAGVHSWGAPHWLSWLVMACGLLVGVADGMCAHVGREKIADLLRLILNGICLVLSVLGMQRMLPLPIPWSGTSKLVLVAMFLFLFADVGFGFVRKGSGQSVK